MSISRKKALLVYRINKYNIEHGYSDSDCILVGRTARPAFRSNAIYMSPSAPPTTTTPRNTKIPAKTSPVPRLNAGKLLHERGHEEEEGAEAAVRGEPAAEEPHGRAARLRVPLGDGVCRQRESRVTSYELHDTRLQVTICKSLAACS